MFAYSRIQRDRASFSWFVCETNPLEVPFSIKEKQEKVKSTSQSPRNNPFLKTSPVIKSQHSLVSLEGSDASQAFATENSESQSALLVSRPHPNQALLDPLPCWIHCMQGDLEGVKEALQAGQDPNERSPFGVSCLMHAARRGHLDILELLLRHPGIDVNTPDNSNLTGGTPLHWAVSGGSVQIVERLLNQPNLDCLDARDVHGYTPLMLAVDRGSCDLIFLLKKKMLEKQKRLWFLASRF